MLAVTGKNERDHRQKNPCPPVVIHALRLLVIEPLFQPSSVRIEATLGSATICLSLKFSYGYTLPIPPVAAAVPAASRLEPNCGDIVVFRLPKDDPWTTPARSGSRRPHPGEGPSHQHLPVKANGATHARTRGSDATAGSNAGRRRCRTASTMRRWIAPGVHPDKHRSTPSAGTLHDGRPRQFD
jgi:hypothetical protein